MREWWSRFRASITSRREIADDDLAKEIQVHLDMEIDDGIDRGMAPKEARLRFGNRALIAEHARNARGFPALESLLQDIRYGLRAMRRSPGFSLVVVLTLALGVGVNTAIFSVVHAVLLKPLPYPDSERLVWFGEATANAPGISVTWVNFQHWRDRNHTFEDMAAFQFAGFTLTGRSEPLVTRGLTVTAPYFGLLGMRPLLGRLFGPADDRPGAAPAIVLNHRFWSGPLGGDPRVVGTALTLDGKPYEVIGVAAPVWETWRVDYYLPLGRAAGHVVDRTRHGSIRVVGRLRTGVTLASACADLDAILRHLAEVDPGPENEHRSYGRFLGEYNTGDVRGALLVLMGAAALILLIACANVASLLLARNTARASELAVRKAIGAGALRLVRQLLTENVVLAALGGLAGLLFAQGALRALIALAPGDIPRLAETSLDLPVLLFAGAITLASGLMAGLAPVVSAGKLDLTTALKKGARTSGGRHRQSLRNVLVVAEVALTFVLAFGAGLLLRSLLAAQTSSPGFDSQRVLSFALQLPSPAYKGPEAVGDFYARLLGSLRALPGVDSASVVHCPPGGGDCGDWFYSIPGHPLPARNEVPISLFNRAEAGYFRMMRIPIRQGREFNETDRAQGPRVAIVNETLARAGWPNESPVGRQIKVGGPYLDGPLLEVVGVAGDVKQFGLDSRPMPEIYQPFAQQRDPGMTLMIRTSGGSEALMASVRRRVSELDGSLPVQRLAPIERTLGAGLARRRFSTLLLTLFAGLACVLAAIGIYGLLSYWVGIRESEIAIRLALGAPPSRIVRWIGFHALRLAVAGIGFGLVGGWAGARVLEDLVFGIPPRNPAALIAAALAVAIIAVFAAAIPAWRGARVDAARRLHAA
ncbi:MAG: ABC transporter permease [Acidobacteria bacterium]|nr:ABC transporter permease [Acidobacteriota bacterium]